MKNKLIPVDIRKVWLLVKPGLEIVAAKCGTTWKPEDIYATLRTSEITHIYMPLDKTDNSFVVLEEQECVFTGDKIVHIWVVYSPKHGARKRYMKEIERLARESGAKWLSLESPRLGFQKDTNWKMDFVSYKREL